MKLDCILDRLGNTPIVKVYFNELTSIDLYVKLEFYNPTGSIKDRAAAYLVDKLLEIGAIKSNTTLIESSSGNFGIALAAYCKKKGLRFCCVIDPNISVINQAIIENLCSSIIKVNEPTSSGGYLLNRIKKVNELISTIPNSYWVNQYSNMYNAEAYYYTLGSEICEHFSELDYIFIGVSSGGTITGISRKVKEKFPKIKVIAVDMEGSVIFGGNPKKRYIPGIGSEMVPDILKHAHIDDVVIVDEAMTIEACYRLLREQFIFAGGSSGSVIAAIMKYFKNKSFSVKPKVLTIFPDRGDRYINTIYNYKWVNEVVKANL